MYAGDFATSEKVANQVLELNNGFAKARLAIALSQLATGRPADAEATYKTLAAGTGSARDLGQLGLADLALFQGHADTAAAFAQVSEPDGGATRSSGAVARLLVTGAEALSTQGRHADAARQAEEALKKSTEPAVVFLAGRVLAAAGRQARAAELAAELQSRVEDEPQVYGRLLAGEAALARNDPRAAMEAFQSTHKIAETWLEHAGLARAYVALGKFAEATSELDYCKLHPGEATAVFLDDIPTWRVTAPLRALSAAAQEGLKQGLTK
jgi:tetratricopeptide (TPR) repeat protein